MAKEMLEKISADELLRQKHYAREKARLDAISRVKYAEIKAMEEATAKLVIKQLKIKFPGLPKVYEEKLLKANFKAMENIAGDIFDIDSIEDLDKYLA